MVNLVISTLVGGVVFLIVAKLIASKLGDAISIPKVFLAVFIINLISLPLIWGLTVQGIAAIPFAGFIFPFLPFLIWLLVVKLVFREMSISHALLIAVIGYILSIYVVPTLVWSIRGVLPV